MTKFVCAILAGVGLVAVSPALIKTRPAAAKTQRSAAVFDSEGKLQEPDPTVFREWIFVGAPLGPDTFDPRPRAGRSGHRPQLYLVDKEGNIRKPIDMRDAKTQ